MVFSNGVDSCGLVRPLQGKKHFIIFIVHNHMGESIFRTYPGRGGGVNFPQAIKRRQIRLIVNIPAVSAGVSSWTKTGKSGKKKVTMFSLHNYCEGTELSTWIIRQKRKKEITTIKFATKTPQFL